MLKAMRVTTALFGAILTVVLVASGCLKVEPDADGRALAELHIQLLEADELTTDQLIEDLKKAKARHETEKARRAFEDAYSETIEPAYGKLAAMLAKDSSREAVKALREIGNELGAEFRGFTKDLAEALGEMSGDDGELKEALREFGRDLGRTLRGVTESVEAIADGMKEELNDK